jgi:hypothetical protein
LECSEGTGEKDSESGDSSNSESEKKISEGTGTREGWQEESQRRSEEVKEGGGGQ